MFSVALRVHAKVQLSIFNFTRFSLMFPRLVFTCRNAAAFGRSCSYEVHTLCGTQFKLSVIIGVSVPRHPLVQHENNF